MNIARIAAAGAFVLVMFALVPAHAQDAPAPATPSADMSPPHRSTVSAPSVRIDPYRRNLQRAYLTVMGDKLNGRQPPSGDGRPLARGELRAIDLAAPGALVKAADGMTRAHLQDVRDQIAKILDPQFAPPAPPAGHTTGVVGGQEGCWLDYAIPSMNGAVY
jgi:hypothetical protein